LPGFWKKPGRRIKGLAHKGFESFQGAGKDRNAKKEAKTGLSLIA